MISPSKKLVSLLASNSAILALDSLDGMKLYVVGALTAVYIVSQAWLDRGVRVAEIRAKALAGEIVP